MQRRAIIRILYNLLCNNTNIYQLDYNGLSSPFLDAIYDNNLPLLQLFLEYNPEPRDHSISQIDPWYFSISCASEQICELLLQSNFEIDRLKKYLDDPNLESKYPLLLRTDAIKVWFKRAKFIVKSCKTLKFICKCNIRSHIGSKLPIEITKTGLPSPLQRYVISCMM